MKKLYQPIMLNKLQLKNRIMMAPCGINNTVDGCMTDQDVAFYRKRAAGGVAVIVVARWEWVKNPAASLGLEDIDVPVYYGRIVAPRKQIYIPKHKLTSNTDQTDMR